MTPGFASVAAAVHDHAGRPTAAVAVTFPAADIDAPGRDGLAVRVSRAATELTRRINGRPPKRLASQTTPPRGG